MRVYIVLMQVSQGHDNCFLLKIFTKDGLKTLLIVTTTVFLILVFGDSSSKNSRVQEAGDSFFNMMLYLF